jgi:hypothetical protein
MELLWTLGDTVVVSMARRFSRGGDRISIYKVKFKPSKTILTKQCRAFRTGEYILYKIILVFVIKRRVELSL